MARESDTFILYQRPKSAPVVLAQAPRLANWDKSTTLGQRALREYLKHVDEIAGEGVRGASGPLSIELSVDIAPTLDL
jgi:hypothetical protein